LRPERPSRRVRACITTIVCLSAVATLAACGGGEPTSSTTAADTGGAPAASSRLETLYAGTYANPPATSPAPPTGKDVWVISPSQSVTIAAAASSAAQRAAKALGWQAHVFDAKGAPDQYLAGIRQAIAAKAEGLVLLYIDCAYVKPGLQEARKAKIKVVAIQSVDCDQAKSGDPSLFDYVTHYQEGDFLTWIKAWGAAQATWDAEVAGGKAKIIEFKETDATATLQSSAGFRAELAKCAGCKVVDTVTFTAADLGTSLQQKAQQAFLSHPDATGVEVPFDGVLTAGVLAAIRAAGAGAKLHVMGGEGDPANLDLIRSGGGQDAAVGTPSPWEAYAAMDGLNRLFAGEDPTKVKTGIGLQIIDKDHNLPASGPFRPIGRDRKPIDFERLYAKAWAAG